VRAPRSCTCLHTPISTPLTVISRGKIFRNSCRGEIGDNPFFNDPPLRDLLAPHDRCARFIGLCGGGGGACCPPAPPRPRYSLASLVPDAAFVWPGGAHRRNVSVRCYCCRHYLWCAPGAVPFRVCEDAKQRQLPNGGPEVQLVYNEKRREYFGVHLTYVPRTLPPSPPFIYLSI
jgi:hypothetical protein